MRTPAVVPLASVVALGSLLAACAGAGNPAVAPRIDLLGMPVDDASATLHVERTIAITPETRWVRVQGGDTVQFIAGAQRFAWCFQVSPNIAVFNLNQVAPPGALARPVLVYVDPDPHYTPGG